MPMQWHFRGEHLMVRCRWCADLFEVDVEGGTEVAYELPEGSDAVMPDGRPIRSLSHIAKDGA